MLGAMGNPVIKTPHLDRLAAQGMSFVNNFVTTSICAVSRASFFTGLYARCHGVHGFQTPLSEEQHAYSYPVRLREEAGYRTGFIGKYGVGRNTPDERFDYFRAFAGQGQYLTEVNGKTVHLTETMGNQALEFLDGSDAEQPWNLSISSKAPHVQDNVAPYFINDPKYDDLFDGAALPPFKHMDGAYYDSLPDYLKEITENRIRLERRFGTPQKWEESVKRYYALIYGVDVQVGRILAKLDELGMRDNTVIVFSGDNGFYLGERGWAGKWYMHEESIRTPLIIADPRRQDSHGKRREEMTLNIDVSPTILSLAGLDLPASINGRDLTPLVAGETPEWRAEWFYEHLFEHAAIPKSEGVRTRDWKYFEFLEREPHWEEMYDLAADPDETRNLAPEPRYAERREQLREHRSAWVESLESWRIDQPWKEPVA